MKKMIKLFMGLIMMVMFIACDNNEGPFTERRENGVAILYSGDKPAKGWVASNVTDYQGVVTKVAEVEMDNGLLGGDFNLYNHFNGKVKVSGKGKLVNGGVNWKGTIVTGRSTFEGLWVTAELSNFISKAAKDSQADFDAVMYWYGTTYAVDVTTTDGIDGEVKHISQNN